MTKVVYPNVEYDIEKVDVSATPGRYQECYGRSVEPLVLTSAL